MRFSGARSAANKPLGYLPVSCLLASVLATTLLAGCATPSGQFKKGTYSGKKAATSQAIQNAPPRPTPYLPPNDLWERIRYGLQLDGHEDEQAVRGMVQFFAGQQRHLTESALRAQPYLRHIVDNVEARNMPMELALLPIVESSFDPFAGGGKRASGLWQFMPITAKRFGLNNNDWYEGRRDVLLSTRAALDYLGWLHGRFDDWLLALAAYNCGEGCVDRAIAKAAARGKPQDYWSLDLPTETERYIPKLLALSELVAQPERFNITWPSTPDTPAFVAVELPARTSLATAADMMGISIQSLRDLNPALRGNITQPGGPHVLLVPANRAEKFQIALAKVADTGRLRWVRHAVTSDETLASISEKYKVDLSELRQTNELASDSLSIGQRIWIPKLPTLPARQRVAKLGKSKRTYRVVSGDSLWRISRAQRVSVAQLQQWNGLSKNAALRPGQKLKIYGGKAAPAKSKSTYYRVRSGDSLWSISQRFNTDMEKLRRLNNLSAKSVLQPNQRLLVAATGPQEVYYQVREGDSLWSIASRYKVPVSQIKAWNSLSSKGIIRPGQRLKILVDTTG